MKLDKHDLIMAVNRIPNALRTIMEKPKWHNKIFVGGGYLRSIVAGETVNDIDVFVSTGLDAGLLADLLTKPNQDVVKTDNAYTIRGAMPIQIIFRWLFDKVEDVSNSFDF